MWNSDCMHVHHAKVSLFKTIPIPIISDKDLVTLEDSKSATGPIGGNTQSSFQLDSSRRVEDMTMQVTIEIL